MFGVWAIVCMLKKCMITDYEQRQTWQPINRTKVERKNTPTLWIEHCLIIPILLIITVWIESDDEESPNVQ